MPISSEPVRGTGSVGGCLDAQMANIDTIEELNLGYCLEALEEVRALLKSVTKHSVHRQMVAKSRVLWGRL